MPAISRELLIVLCAIAVVLAVGQTIARVWTKAARRRRILRRLARAGAGEAHAAEALADAGYTIHGAQVAADYDVCVDGLAVSCGVRADYLVEKDGRSYVVEVKTGALAPRIATAATRRQLLEYRVVFDVDGVLLFDAEEGTLAEITFPNVGRADPGEPRGFGIGWTLLAFVAAAIAIAVVISRSTL